MKEYNFYHFIYYKLYKLAIKSEEQWGKNLQMPELVSLVTFSILKILNMGFVIIFFNSFLKIEIEVNTAIGIIILISIYGFNYFVFLFKKKYLKIGAYFDKIKEQRKNVLDFMFWFYVLATIISFITVIIV